MKTYETFARDLDRLLGLAMPVVVAGADDGIRAIGLALAGRRDEARQRVLAMRQPSRIPAFQEWIDYLLAWIDRRTDDMLVRLSRTGALKIQDDPEAIFQEGWLLCDVGRHADGLPHLRRALDHGYFVADLLKQRPQFDALRGTPEFEALVETAERGRERALAAFRDAGGDRLLA